MSFKRSSCRACLLGYSQGWLGVMSLGRHFRGYPAGRQCPPQEMLILETSSLWMSFNVTRPLRSRGRVVLHLRTRRWEAPAPTHSWVDSVPLISWLLLTAPVGDAPRGTYYFYRRRTRRRPGQTPRRLSCGRVTAAVFHPILSYAMPLLHFLPRSRSASPSTTQPLRSPTFGLPRRCGCSLCGLPLEYCLLGRGRRSRNGTNFSGPSARTLGSAYKFLRGLGAMGGSCGYFSATTSSFPTRIHLAVSQDSLYAARLESFLRADCRLKS